MEGFACAQGLSFFAWRVREEGGGLSDAGERRLPCCGCSGYRI